MDENVVPAAREAMTEELEARRLRDRSSFEKRFQEDAIVTKADGLQHSLWRVHDHRLKRVTDCSP